MRKYVYIVLLLLANSFSFGQARLVMNNDGYLVISNSAFLVIGNSSANAITELGSGGRIISEAEGNKVRWMISNGTGTYTVPFYENGEGVEIPVSIAITGAGTAGASNRIDFSTYDGGSDNATYMPSGVTNMGNTTVPTANNSLMVTDRFWMLDANHATKPSATLSFTYVDNENAAPNTLAEANLKAQRWNASTADWDGFLFPPVGTANTATNVVSGVTAPAADFFRVWTLVDFTTPLPIELLSTTIGCTDDRVLINWSTASETNNDYFTIEKSTNGIDFFAIGTVPGAGTSTSVLNYSFEDLNSSPETNYYRLKQTDFDGTTEFFPVLISQGCGLNTFSINAFNDQQGSIVVDVQTDEIDVYEVLLFDGIGKKVRSQQLTTLPGKNELKMDIQDLCTGVYNVAITNSRERIVRKIPIIR